MTHQLVTVIINVQYCIACNTSYSFTRGCKVYKEETLQLDKFG